MNQEGGLLTSHMRAKKCPTFCGSGSYKYAKLHTRMKLTNDPKRQYMNDVYTTAIAKNKEPMTNRNNDIVLEDLCSV